MVDKLYRNRDNINFSNQRGIRISGPRLGRPKKDETYDKTQAYIDSGIRNQVEGKFGIGKIKYGLDRVMTKLKDTSEAEISLAFLAMNLVKSLCVFLRFLMIKRSLAKIRGFLRMAYFRAIYKDKLYLYEFGFGSSGS
jgi:hypothetical protein